MANPTDDKTALPPEIPPEVAERQRQSTALTPWAADDPEKPASSYRSAKDGSDIQIVRDAEAARRRLIARRAQIDAINELTAKPVGYEPHAGLTAAQVTEIMAKSYPGQPVMGMMGDTTPEFIIWLFQNHPRDAHVRYYIRLMPDVGTWISRNHPRFVYRPAGNVVHADFTLPNTTGREIETVGSVKAALVEEKSAKQQLLEEVRRLKEELAEDEETAALKKELKLLKAQLAKKNKPTVNTPIATRRPRRS